MNDLIAKRGNYSTLETTDTLYRDQVVYLKSHYYPNEGDYLYSPVIIKEVHPRLVTVRDVKRGMLTVPANALALASTVLK